MSLYPPSPKLSNLDFINPTKNFKNAAIAVIVSVLLFLLFYLILVCLSIFILAGSFWLGYTIIMSKPMLLTIAAGFGLMGLGIMFFIFMIKFIFAKKVDEDPLRIQLKEKDHPELFEFIRKLTTETKTKFPKKIFISPEVNASVFYNSSFWSLFFPVRKNLLIGLGLVNTLNISELKSVLAHEFGHFSQRSMKIGSYIYTVNQAIYNLVFEHDNWDETLIKWSETGGIFSLFAGITYWLVQRVRGLLKIAYRLVNINYMKLSREMEYHADLVAVSVTGNDVFKSSLRKLEFSSYAFDYTTNKLSVIAQNEKSSKNILADHNQTMRFLGKLNDIEFNEYGFNISEEQLGQSITKSRIHIKDQWASHPSLQEREKNIDTVSISSEINNKSSWLLFQDPQKLQELASRIMYSNAFPSAKYSFLEDDEYVNQLERELSEFQINERYKGFYDNRHLADVDLENLIFSETRFEDIYSNENLEKIKRHQSNLVDLETLIQISNKLIDVKFFDFDGTKYKRKHAKNLVTQIREEINQGFEWLKDLDRKSIAYNISISADLELLKKSYRQTFEDQKNLTAVGEVSEKFGNFMQRLYSQHSYHEEEVSMLATDLAYIEKEFRNVLSFLNSDEIIKQLDVESQKTELSNYITKDFLYTRSHTLDETGLAGFSNVLGLTMEALSTQYGKNLKTLTDLQLQNQN